PHRLASRPGRSSSDARERRRLQPARLLHLGPRRPPAGGRGHGRGPAGASGEEARVGRGHGTRQVAAHERIHDVHGGKNGLHLPDDDGGDDGMAADEGALHCQRDLPDARERGDGFAAAQQDRLRAGQRRCHRTGHLQGAHDGSAAEHAVGLARVCAPRRTSTVLLRLPLLHLIFDLPFLIFDLCRLILKLMSLRSTILSIVVSPFHIPYDFCLVDVIRCDNNNLKF
ncbi:hypothetical protein PENTCL1PPCAC_25426, partial [Pristionchus entomophagus]